MIKNFLIINCTGKNNVIGLRIDNNFFIQELQTNTQENDKWRSNYAEEWVQIPFDTSLIL